MAQLVGKKFTRNGVVATIVSVNSKFKTLVLEFQDGSTQSISTSTLTKHWVECGAEEIPTEEVTIEEEPKQEEAPVVETVIEQPKEKKAPKAKKEAKERAPRKSSDMHIIDHIVEVLTEMGINPNHSTTTCGCNGFQFYKRNTRVQVYSKKHILEVDPKFYSEMKEDKMGKHIYVDYANIDEFLHTYFA